jgi:hypothetical protein
MVLLLAACAAKPAPPAPGGPWECPTDTCLQRHPRLPDDGEWECAEVEGVAVCRSIAAAAGAVPGPASRAWTCGDGAGPEAEGRRICVDLAPETPDGKRAGWRCRFAHNPEQRVCKRDPAAAAPPAHPEPRPSCWLDGDCAEGQRCRVGSCR